MINQILSIFLLRYSYICQKLLLGLGKCPPEDVGGIPGFMEFLKAMKDENHPERDSYIEWCGSVFDPREFKIQQVNYLLGLIFIQKLSLIKK